MFFSSLPSFLFTTASKRTQNSFTTIRHILDGLFILMFISIVVYTVYTFLFTLTCLFLFTLTYNLGKSSLLTVRIIFLWKTSQPMFTTWRRGKKEHFFYRTFLNGWFSHQRLFSFRTEKGRRAFEEEKNEILQRNVEENTYNIVQNQEQVAVSSIASVVKPSTPSCSAGKNRISNKNSSSGSREWTHNGIIELIAI